MRDKLVIFNCIMTRSHTAYEAVLGESAAGCTNSPGRELAVCVPFPYLMQTQAALSSTSVSWGAQDVSEHPSGAFTGEVSAGMLAEFGCRYAIVGHSERRQYFGDSDGVVAAKAKAALGK